MDNHLSPASNVWGIILGFDLGSSFWGFHCRVSLWGIILGLDFRVILGFPLGLLDLGFALVFIGAWESFCF